jgi:CelD/BcsL family acetyltransferase involved in cellulose biosynthesis
MTATSTALKLAFSLTPFHDAGEENWNALFNESRSENLFYHHAFVEATKTAWKDVFPDVVILGRSGERLALIQPLKIYRSPLGKTVEILRMPTADGIAPLVVSARREEAIAELLQFIHTSLRPDLLIARSVTEAFANSIRLHFASAPVKELGSAIGYYLDLPASLEEFWASYKSNFRNQLKRKIKNGENAGLVFRHVDADNLPPGYDLQQALANLTRLHKMRFDDMNRPSFFLMPEFQAFHSSLCERLKDRSCAAAFTEVLLEGEVVASIYGIRTQPVYIYIMIGFDPAISSLSPGNLAIYKTIERLIEQKVEKFDFKCGEDPYKERWTKSFYTKFSICIPFNLRGRVLYKLLLAQAFLNKLSRAPGKLKRILTKRP